MIAMSTLIDNTSETPTSPILSPDRFGISYTSPDRAAVENALSKQRASPPAQLHLPTPVAPMLTTARRPSPPKLTLPL